jgi:glucosyl-dolichyl phosphate glucuronosyltransferase
MKISVVLCTYNRCEMLEPALDSLADSTLPAAVEWEILVVDNNSSDRTRSVVERFCKRYPGRFRYLFESRPGKSFALNTGIRNSQGDVIAFMDDDAVVDATWLQNLTAPLDNPTWAGVGGRTIPMGAFAPPNWLCLESQYALAPIGGFDLGPVARELDEAPIGNNMAYRRVMFEKYGGFRTDLGPRGTSRDPQKCEDSEFGCRLLAAGERLRYEPSAVVHHSVSESRLQKKYFLAWWFDKGRSDVRAFGPPDGIRFYVGKTPLVLLRRIVFWTFRWSVSLDPGIRFYRKLNVWLNAGLLVECRQARTAERPTTPRRKLPCAIGESAIEQVVGVDTSLRG